MLDAVGGADLGDFGVVAGATRNVESGSGGGSGSSISVGGAASFTRYNFAYIVGVQLKKENDEH